MISNNNRARKILTVDANQDTNISRIDAVRIAALLNWIIA